MKLHFLLIDNNKNILKIENFTSELKAEGNQPRETVLSDGRHLFDAARWNSQLQNLLKFSPTAFGRVGLRWAAKLLHTNRHELCAQHTCMRMHVCAHSCLDLKVGL